MSVKTTNSILLKNTSRGAFVAALLASSSLAGAAMAQTTAASTDTNAGTELFAYVPSLLMAGPSSPAAPAAPAAAPAPAAAAGGAL